jgi:hypothetical protein
MGTMPALQLLARLLVVCKHQADDKPQALGVHMSPGHSFHSVRNA